jgi:hypothetical protein
MVQRWNIASNIRGGGFGKSKRRNSIVMLPDYMAKDFAAL